MPYCWASDSRCASRCRMTSINKLTAIGRVPHADGPQGPDDRDAGQHPEQRAGAPVRQARKLREEQPHRRGGQHTAGGLARRAAARQEEPDADSGQERGGGEDHFAREVHGVPPCGRVFIGSASLVWSYTLRSFSLSKTISSRLCPERSKRLVSSIASTGQASSQI